MQPLPKNSFEKLLHLDSQQLEQYLQSVNYYYKQNWIFLITPLQFCLHLKVHHAAQSVQSSMDAI